MEPLFTLDDVRKALMAFDIVKFVRESAPPLKDPKEEQALEMIAVILQAMISVELIAHLKKKAGG